MAKLGELYKITSGGTPSRNHSEYYEDGNIPWVKTGDLKDKYLFGTDEKISQWGLENSSARIYLKNTVLLAMYGATIGATSILKIDAATNQACAAFSPREDVLPEYLYAFLESQKDRFIKDAVGGAQPNLSAGYLKNIEFDYPPLEQQIKITSTLNKIDELLLLRKQQITKLDELVKARFVEMFGDEQTFNKEPLSQNVEEMFIGPFGSSLKNDNFVSKDNGYCMVYEQKHAIRKTMDVETRYIDKPKYDELKRFSIHGGDIIVSCRGTIGETYIIPLNAPLGIMHPSIMKIRVKDSIYNRVFFDFLLQEKLKQHEAQANGSGVKMAVTASALGKEEFIVPSIPFQNQFAAFVERVNQQKQTVQQSLEKLELLKKALMQEYFG